LCANEIEIGSIMLAAAEFVIHTDMNDVVKIIAKRTLRAKKNTFV
jgi:hypothetical protein